MVSRRDFLRRLGCATAGSFGAARALEMLGLVGTAAAQTAPSADYKALVCVFLNGGNDSNNMLVPTNGTLRTAYESGRGILSLPTADLAPISPLNTSQGFGLHPALGNLADLFDAGELAFACNGGTLVEPVPSRDAYLSGSVVRPRNLFSHSDQVRQWHTGVADSTVATGWGGRTATLVNDVFNSSSNVSMTISVTGQRAWIVPGVGGVQGLPVNPNGSALSGVSSALNSDGTYKTTTQGWRLYGLEQMAQTTTGHHLEQAVADVLLSARMNEAVLADALAIADGTGTDFDAPFTATGVDHGFLTQMKHVARLIAGRTATGNNRQLYFVSLGGFDNHRAMLESHGERMTIFNAGMSAFHQLMSSLGVNDSVTTFTMTDFNRTFTPNGTDETAGSDHAWGGHQIVMGGAVSGRNIYGEFPELTVAGGIDAGSTRGRWIPQHSVEQYGTMLASWFGATDADLDAIFPLRSRFDDPRTVASVNLGFLPTA